MPKYAIADLGTNTFHLLIAEKIDATVFKVLHRQRFFVKLAEEGIETIGATPLNRAWKALTAFRKTLDTFQIEPHQLKIIGTAALRTASNGLEFISGVKEKLNISIELIDGSREAELIAKGVRLAVPFEEKNYLIMDIGGGSVEFIIANPNQLLWAQSFPIGVAVLYKKFHQSDPITQAEITKLEAFLTNSLTPLFTALTQFSTKTLIGASGTFDVLENVLSSQKTSPDYGLVPLDNFPPLYQQLVNATTAERFAMQEVPDTRADMIVVAVVLIDFILRKVPIDTLLVSNFAMKEGILAEFLAA